MREITPELEEDIILQVLTYLESVEAIYIFRDGVSSLERPSDDFCLAILMPEGTNMANASNRRKRGRIVHEVSSILDVRRIHFTDLRHSTLEVRRDFVRNGSMVYASDEDAVRDFEEEALSFLPDLSDGQTEGDFQDFPVPPVIAMSVMYGRVKIEVEDMKVSARLLQTSEARLNPEMRMAFKKALWLSIQRAAEICSQMSKICLRSENLNGSREIVEHYAVLRRDKIINKEIEANIVKLHNVRNDMAHEYWDLSDEQIQAIVDNDYKYLLEFARIMASPT